MLTRELWITSFRRLKRTKKRGKKQRGTQKMKYDKRSFLNKQKEEKKKRKCNKIMKRKRKENNHHRMQHTHTHTHTHKHTYTHKHTHTHPFLAQGQYSCSPRKTSGICAEQQPYQTAAAACSGYLPQSTHKTLFQAHQKVSTFYYQ